MPDVPDRVGEVNTGIRSVLCRPSFYNLVQNALGANRGRRRLADRYIRAKPQDDVLDMGCGTADILDFLPEVHYLGFDTSLAYIEAARRKFGDRAEFIHGSVNDVGLPVGRQFDIVLAIGVLHHLTDSEAFILFRSAREALRLGGRFLSVDGCFIEQQSPLARFFLRMDRGKQVRKPEGYLSLARTAFEKVQGYSTSELVRFPYTHMIMEAVAD